MNRSYITFVNEAEEAIRDFPDLKLFSREDSLPYLEGSVSLPDEQGELIDQYFIKIDCTSDYPNSFPLVYETSGRLPHNIDWHIYPNGHFCICTPPEEYIYCTKRINLVGFLKAHVLPYLFNQKFREENGYFLNERSHGKLGILESLQDILKTENRNKVIELLIYIFKNNEPLRTWKCFCGNNKKYRHCHKEAFQSIKSLGQERLKNTIESLL